jgi:toxin CptA
MPWSNASVPCRFELRPSRWVIGAMLALSVLAPIAVLASAMPRWVAWPLSMLAVVIGLRMAWRENAQPILEIVVDADAQGRATIGGTPVDAFRVDWRGPLAFITWRHADGQRCRRSLWPDTLSSATRRELRLAVRAGGDGQARSSVAP